MAKTISVEVFEYDELDEKAQARARDWYREGDREFFSECAGRNVLDDAVRMFGIMGWTFDTHEVRLMGGGTRRDPSVSWQLGYMQSDGVWIEASYSHAKGSTRKIREEAPEDKTLHTIADRLLELQKQHGYRLNARVRHNDRGPMDLDVESDARDERARVVGEETYFLMREIVRDIERWIYDQLRTEDEYQSSDEVVADNIRANEYTFRANGERFDW